MPTEDQNQPRRNLKSFWLLLFPALGLCVLVASWKKPPPPHPPTEFGTVEQLKYDAYRQTKYLVIGRVIQGQPKGSTIIGFAPYSKGTVTKLGPTRFLCSSSFTMRSQTGALLKERWKCILTGTHNNWACESFQHTPPERVSPGRAGLAANVADVQ